MNKEGRLMSDEVLVALIAESVQAPSTDRRKAAGILLDVLRTSPDLIGLDNRMTALHAQAGVVEEARQLVVRYHLDC